MPKLMIDGLAASGSFSAANAAKYNNEKSGLEATNVQSAIDELAIEKQNSEDNNLSTESKEIVGAINEIVSTAITTSNIGNQSVNHASTADSATNATNATNASTVNNLTVQTAVPANAKFTDTVISVINNLTSTSTTAALSAAQGKALNTAIGKKQDASTAITTSNIGSQTVSKAGSCTGNSATATTAAKLGRNGSTSTPMTFNWSGQSGQPAWLWGGSDGTNMYVYNPSNFSVYASTTTSWWYGAVHVHSTSIYNIGGGTGTGMFSNDQINSWIIGSGASESNTAVFVSNGDGNTMSAHTEGATYVSGWWYVTLSAAHGGAARINWMILRWN